MWARLRAWLLRLVAPWWSPGSREVLTAREAMEELRRSKATPGDPVEFARLRNRLGVLVLSAADRSRLWRRARGSDARPLEGLTAPTSAEERDLRAIIEQLERGR